MVKTTDGCSKQPVIHKRKNGTDWIRSRKINAFLSLRIRRQIDLSALLMSTTSNLKTLLCKVVCTIFLELAVEAQGNMSYGSGPQISCPRFREDLRFKGDSHSQNIQEQHLDQVINFLSCSMVWKEELGLDKLKKWKKLKFYKLFSSRHKINKIITDKLYQSCELFFYV